MRAPNRQTVRTLKILIFLACLLPLATLMMETFNIAGRGLGANPIEEILHRFGKWGLNFLLITLAVTPLRRISGQHWLVRFRRMLGLFALFYVSMHLLSYAILDQQLDLAAVAEDILERPYITLGMTAIVLLIPLGLTSTNAMMRRLGRRWQQLHYLIYPAATLGVWHFYWQVKQDVREPFIYATILAVLLGYRIWVRKRKPQRKPAIGTRMPGTKEHLAVKGATP